MYFSAENNDCKNNHLDCDYWAGIGECDKNPSYMLIHCMKSCNVCENQGKYSLKITVKRWHTKNWRKLTKIFKFWAQLKCVNLCRITVIVNRTNKRKPSQQSYSRTIKQFVNSHSENGNTILLPQQWRMSRQEKLLFNPWRR